MRRGRTARDRLLRRSPQCRRHPQRTLRHLPQPGAGQQSRGRNMHEDPAVVARLAARARRNRAGHPHDAEKPHSFQIDARSRL